MFASKHVQRIDDQRARDPGDVPDGELAVAAVDAADVSDLEGRRVGQGHRQQRGNEKHKAEFLRATSVTVAHRGHFPAGTAMKRIRTPRLR